MRIFRTLYMHVLEKYIPVSVYFLLRHLKGQKSYWNCGLGKHGSRFFITPLGPRSTELKAVSWTITFFNFTTVTSLQISLMKRKSKFTFKLFFTLITKIFVWKKINASFVLKILPFFPLGSLLCSEGSQGIPIELWCSTVSRW